jgi:hypothetical protein
MRQVYKLENGGYGYSVEIGNFKIKQEHKPAYSGLQLMTEEEAGKLAELVEEKMKQGLSPTLTIEQMEGLWSAVKTHQQIIDEEKDFIASHPPQPLELP